MTLLSQDPVFKYMEALDRVLTIDSKERVVFKPNASTQPWMKEILRYLHMRREGPDVYIMECVRQITLQFTTEMRTKLVPDEDVGTSAEVYERILMDAGDDYANELTRHASDTRRWLMWRNGIHWKFIDESIRNGAPSDFEAAIWQGMQNQLFAIGKEMLDYIDIMISAADETQEQTCSKLCSGCRNVVSQAEWQACRKAVCPAEFERLEIPGIVEME